MTNPKKIARISYVSTEQAREERIGLTPSACYRVQCEGSRPYEAYHCLSLEAAIEFCDNGGRDYLLSRDLPDLARK